MPEVLYTRDTPVRITSGSHRGCSGRIAGGGPDEYGRYAVLLAPIAHPRLPSLD